MFIDTHCHISHADYDDIDLLIAENVKAGVDKLIVSGCDSDSINEVIELSKKYDEVYLSLGYHPEYCCEVGDKELIQLEHLLSSNKKVVALGEIGLDYHYCKDNRSSQIKLFKRQLDIAQKLNLPVVIHSRDATLDTINILKQYNLDGVIHCFSGSLEIANIYISLGFKLGIGGVVTFKNSKLSQVIKNITLDNIVLETDSPYLTPDPYRGKVNSSKYIPLIANYIAGIYNVDLSTVANITTANAKKIFNID